MLIFFWVCVLVVHWAFLQNEPANWIEEEEIEVNFDLAYFLTWLMGLVLMIIK